MKNGYKAVCLCKGGKRIKYYAHRIIATLFVDNPNNFKEVDHINRKTTDCRAINLRWVDRSGNMRNKNTIKKIVLESCDSISLRVAAIDIETNTITYIFPSVECAARFFKATSTSIRKAVKDGSIVSHGYRWAMMSNETYMASVVLPKTI